MNEAWGYWLCLDGAPGSLAGPARPAGHRTRLRAKPCCPERGAQTDAKAPSGLLRIHTASSPTCV